jgi:hypothetical protein
MSADYPRTVRRQSLQILTWAVNVWSSERVRIFMGDSQSSACLWNVQCAQKTVIRELTRLILLQNIWSHCYWSWEKIIATGLNVVALHLIWSEEECPSRNFSKCLFYFGGQKQKVTLRRPDELFNSEPMQLAIRLCLCWNPPLNKRCVHKRFTYFGRYVCVYIYIYTGCAKKMYTHFNRWYLCIVFEVELNYHYSM